MNLKAPTDRKRPTASINWLLRQLKSVEREDLLIRAVWPRRLRNTTGSISSVRDDPTCLIHEGVRELPQSFEVIRVIDMAGKFSGVKTFVECATAEVPLFYKDVGERLRAWVPPPPKLKRESAAEQDQDTDKDQAAENEPEAKEFQPSPSEDLSVIPGVSVKAE